LTGTAAGGLSSTARTSAHTANWNNKPEVLKLKKKIFLGIVFVLIIAAAVFTYFQLIRPLSVKSIEVYIRELDGEPIMDYYRKEYQKYLEAHK
jgi:hypothetical protein